MIKFLGKLSRQKVNELYKSSRAGIVIYQPAPNHIDAQPIKMFEFMAAGLPVVASNFPLWKNIIEDSGCGICVDPQDKNDVRNACVKLINNVDICHCMGKAGRKAVEERYNWNVEARKLLELYENI